MSFSFAQTRVDRFDARPFGSLGEFAGDRENLVGRHFSLYRILNMIYKEKNMEENFMTFAANMKILEAYTASKGPPDYEREWRKRNKPGGSSSPRLKAGHSTEEAYE